jgi:MFS family permease
MEIGMAPWLLALLTAAWFGWMAHRQGRNIALWGVGGFAFGLVISTLVLGLGQARTIPFSDHERKVDQIEWTVAAVVLIAAVGWLLTASLHRHHVAVWRKFKPGADSTDLTSAESRPGAAAASKQTVGRTQS